MFEEAALESRVARRAGRPGRSPGASGKPRVSGPGGCTEEAAPRFVGGGAGAPVPWGTEREGALSPGGGKGALGTVRQMHRRAVGAGVLAAAGDSKP